MGHSLIHCQGSVYAPGVDFNEWGCVSSRPFRRRIKARLPPASAFAISEGREPYGWRADILSAPTNGGMMITDQHLRDAYLTPQMKHYFDRKLAPLSSDEVDIRIDELLKYLNMAEHHPGDLPVSSEIDEVWHYWILETREYAQLCSKLRQGAFLHHTSTVYSEYGTGSAAGNDGDRKVNLERELGPLISYVKNYGRFGPSRVKYWTFATILMDLKKFSLEQLNDRLEAAVRFTERM